MRRAAPLLALALGLLPGCGQKTPDTSGGSIVVGRSRGASPQAFGSASFQRPATTLLDPFTPGLQTVSPLSLADGSCGDVSTVVDSAVRLPLDAGTSLAVTDPPASWPLLKVGGAYLGTAAVASYAAGSNLMVQGPGGADLGAFSVSIVAPGDTTLLAPDLTGGLLKVLQTTSLALSWSAGGGESVFAEALQGDTGSAVAWACRFPDTGSAVLGSSFWMHFQPSLSVPDLSATLLLYREHQSTAPVGSGSPLFAVDAWTSRLELH